MQRLECLVVIRMRVKVEIQLADDEVQRHQLTQRRAEIGRLVDQIHKRQIQPRKQRAACQRHALVIRGLTRALHGRLRQRQRRALRKRALFEIAFVHSRSSFSIGHLPRTILCAVGFSGAKARKRAAPDSAALKLSKSITF